MYLIINPVPNHTNISIFKIIVISKTSNIETKYPAKRVYFTNNIPRSIRIKENIM